MNKKIEKVMNALERTYANTVAVIDVSKHGDWFRWIISPEQKTTEYIEVNTQCYLSNTEIVAMLVFNIEKHIQNTLEAYILKKITVGYRIILVDLNDELLYDAQKVYSDLMEIPRKFYYKEVHSINIDYNSHDQVIIFKLKTIKESK